MEIIKMEDSEDGSCLMTIELQEDEIQKLIDYGLYDILRKEIEKYTMEERKDDK